MCVSNALSFNAYEEFNYIKYEANEEMSNHKVSTQRSKLFAQISAG